MYSVFSWVVYQKGVKTVYSGRCCGCIAVTSAAAFGLSFGCLAFLQVTSVTLKKSFDSYTIVDTLYVEQCYDIFDLTVLMHFK